ncbi:hypothetical protein TNCV_2365981 [Trichonephila clavipes]|nr:hypothetical protein TNCV_2365981 [Trichonephila clavipes]
MQSKKRIGMGAGRKDQSLQDGCRLFTYKFFFQTQQQDHKQAEEPLSTYVVLRLVPSNDPVQLSMLCIDLGGLSWWHCYLFGMYSIIQEPLSGHL